MNLTVRGRKAVVSMITFISGIGLYFGVKRVNHDLHPPAIHIDSEDVDFGTIPADMKVTRSVTISNAGASSLEIRDIKTGCGCTEVFMSTSVLAPGERADLYITITGKGTASDDIVDVVVFSNAPETPAARIRVRYGSVSDLVVEPEQILFGSVSRSDLPATVHSKILVRKQTEATDLDQAELIIDDDFLTASISRSNHASVGDAFQVDVHLRENAPSGEVYSKLRILDKSRDSSFHLDIFGNVVGEFYSIPVMLDFGKVFRSTEPLVRNLKTMRRGWEQGTESPEWVVSDVIVSKSLSSLITADPSGTPGGDIVVRMTPGTYDGVWSDRQIVGGIRFICESRDVPPVREEVNVPVRLMLRMPHVRDSEDLASGSR